MNLLAILVSLAAAHVNMPADFYGAAGVQVTWNCDAPEAGPRTIMLTGTALRTDQKVCYLDHNGTEVITASFTDGSGTVNCAGVTLNMSPFPGFHFRSPCRAVFRFNQIGRSCDAQCVNMPWTGSALNVRPTAFPNPLRVSSDSAMNFINLQPGARVRIYSMTGRLVKEGTTESDGSYHWDLDDTDGRKVGSGVYLVVTQTSSGAQKLKVAVQR